MASWLPVVFKFRLHILLLRLKFMNEFFTCTIDRYHLQFGARGFDTRPATSTFPLINHKRSNVVWKMTWETKKMYKNCEQMSSRLHIFRVWDVQTCQAKRALQYVFEMFYFLCLTFFKDFSYLIVWTTILAIYKDLKMVRYLCLIELLWSNLTFMNSLV